MFPQREFYDILEDLVYFLCVVKGDSYVRF